MPTISFIVPLYNHLQHTQEMLDSLIQSLPEWLDYEIILVDDASTDSTREWLYNLNSPRIRFLINQDNQGYARTNNRGIAEAKGEYLGLLNNDLLFELGWFEPMFEILTNSLLNTGLVGNIQYKIADQTIDHTGVQLNLCGQFEHIHDISENKAYQKISWVTGACIFIRRGFFQALNGFDTNYLNGCEDIDLCFKVQQTKKSIFISYKSCIQHHVSLSRGKVSLQNERNSQILFKRWRREIKQILAQQWTQKLQTDPTQTFNEYLGGYLSPALLATPHLAGRIIAESMLVKQEKRWAEILPQSNE